MQFLIKNATILHPNSEFHRDQLDIFIKNGIIESIEKEFSKYDTFDVEVLDAKGAFVSPGWLDVGVQVGDPGFEHREDLQSAAAAASAGGFTAIACFPNTYPAIHSKSEALYLKNNTKHGLVDFFPIGAVSMDCEGKDITEMYDMHAAGAVAFSDGKNALLDGGLMMRALQYVKPFDGVIINQPYEHSISPAGQIHEGKTSISLGLAGIPNLAEELMVQRDIYLAEYADSRVHIANISSAGSVELIRKAKAQGLKVTASVAAVNLAFDDAASMEFDSNFKMLPPLREAEDIEALKNGLKDGTIDLISSNHVPLEKELKNLEFLNAAFGVIGLETAFAAANTHLQNLLDPSELLEKFALNPRKILHLPLPEIKLGAKANLTIFDTDSEWTFSEKDIFSKSKNTPFLGANFKGRALAVVNNNRYSIENQR